MMKFMRAPTIEAPPEPRSAERQALAQAIEAQAQAEQTSRAASAAADDAYGIYLDATGARRAATAALAEARRGGDKVEILDAIERETQASAAVEPLRAVRERREAERERPEEALKWAQRKLSGCVQAVVGEELERLTRIAGEASERAVAALSALIACDDGARLGARHFDTPGLRAARNEINSFRQDFVDRAKRHSAGAAFRLWRTALETDADAPIPGGP